MEQHFQQVINESRVAQTFTNFHMHEFVEKSKRKTAEGNCLILEWSKEGSTGPIFYIKMNNFDFCKRINDSIFVRVRYLRSSSYLFFSEFNENLVYAVSMLNESPDLTLFEAVLTKNGTIADYQSASLKYETKVRIDFHVDHVLENEVIINFNTSAKIGKAIGGFFGKINNTISKKAAEAEARYQDELKRITQNSFSDSTRSKWGNFVQKISAMNEKMTEVIKPVNETIVKAVSEVSEKYNTSENQYVKTIRQFTKEAQDSINEGYHSDSQPVVAQNNQGGNPPGAEDNSMNMMGQHLILNEQVPEKSPYPEI